MMRVLPFMPRDKRDSDELLDHERGLLDEERAEKLVASADDELQRLDRERWRQQLVNPDAWLEAEE